MQSDIQSFNDALPLERQGIVEVLAQIIDSELTEATSKLWHGAPVWFLNDNPVVGYSSLKADVRLLFWSGRSFDEDGLLPEGTFKAAEARYTDVSQINEADVRRWLKKSRDIQWDYKNIVKRKGKLERL